MVRSMLIDKDPGTDDGIALLMGLVPFDGNISNNDRGRQRAFVQGHP